MYKKIYKHRQLIFLVILKTVKFKILKLFSSNRKFLRLSLSNEKASFIDSFPHEIMQHKEHILSLTTKIISKIFPNTSCIVSCNVKMSVLHDYNLDEKICLGVIVANGNIYAHSWLSSEKPSGHQKIN